MRSSTLLMVMPESESSWVSLLQQSMYSASSPLTVPVTSSRREE